MVASSVAADPPPWFRTERSTCAISAGRSDLVLCALCWELVPAARCLAVADRGTLCATCVDSVSRAK